jgi:HrpA-like RNA helicase
LFISLDKHDKNWAWTNYLSLRALQQADNVRAQLQRNMERFDIDLVSLSDEKKLYLKIRQALVCGFFMQVAHKEGEKGNYLTVKDNQVSLDCCLSSFSPSSHHPSYRWLHCIRHAVWTPNLNGLYLMNSS